MSIILKMINVFRLINTECLKYHGEVELLKNKIKNSIIIRTSGCTQNINQISFSKLSQGYPKMLILKVVNNQFGSPTNSEDLVIAILTIIPKINNESTEIFHFSNIGKCSRYEFSTEIEKLLSKNKKSIIMPVICKDEFLKRPKNTSLNCNKISLTYGIKLIDWKKIPIKIYKQI